MRVLVADDHSLFLEGITLILRSVFERVEIIQVQSWPEVHKLLYRQPHWDLLLLDLFMPTRSHWKQELDAISAMLSQDANVCVVSASCDPQHIQTVFKAGIRGYLPKTSNLQELKTALQKVSSGQIYIPEQCWQTQKINRSIKITNRQQEILNLVASGKSNKQIANSLGLTEGTIKRHMYNIFQIFNVTNRVEAIDYARNTGILSKWG